MPCGGYESPGIKGEGIYAWWGFHDNCSQTAVTRELVENGDPGGGARPLSEEKSLLLCYSQPPVSCPRSVERKRSVKLNSYFIICRVVSL